MKLLRAATLSVKDVESSASLYAKWLDFSVCEQGTLDETLAASWGRPGATGQKYVVMKPASQAPIYLRLVENTPSPDFVPLRSYGWAAIEVCVEDVLAANDRLLDSPFKVIGPPREIEGLDAIYPMQMLGPDGEIVYLTQIRGDLPEFDLPRAQAPIDRLFILVLACSDMNESLRWLEKYTDFAVGREKLEIVYTMLAKAFGLPEEDLHVIATMVHGRDVFLELDQLPDIATARPGNPENLPAGVAIGTFWTPDFDAFDKRCSALWITPPAVHDSCVYAGKRHATLRAPDGTLLEIVET